MLEFSDKKVIGTVLVPIQITEEDIENIIVTSFEQGSNYWLGLEVDYPEYEDRPDDEPYSTWTTKLLLEGKEIHLYDIEDDNEKWTLTLDKLMEGIKLNAKNRPFDSDIENGDATTADCIMQYALFNELVYA
jgi:hypothetical protein